MSNATGYVPPPPPFDPSCERQYLYGVLTGVVVTATAIGLLICVFACQPRKRIKQTLGKLSSAIKLEEEGTLVWKDGGYEISQPLLVPPEAGVTAVEEAA